MVEQTGVTVLAATFYSRKEVLVVQGKLGFDKPVFQVVAYKENKSEDDDDEEKLVYIKDKNIILRAVNFSLFNNNNRQNNSINLNDDENGIRQKKRKHEKVDGEDEETSGLSRPLNVKISSSGPTNLSLPAKSSYPFPITASDDESDENNNEGSKKKNKRKKESKNSSSSSSSSAMVKALALRILEQEENLKKPELGVIPKGGTLQTVLVQALHTNDETLLENCFNFAGGNEKTIKTTVKKLPLPYVLPLLTKVVAKFQSQPSRALSFILWIKQVIRIHSAYLLQLPEATSGPITSLFSIIDGRVAVFRKLLKLSGRLDLLLSQAPKGGESGEDIQEGPLLNYTEGAPSYLQKS